MSILLTNIQRFSLHDGPGIRTTVFLKGCSLRCPWCCNPENLLPAPQEYVKDGVKGTYGQVYTAEELVKECLKDRLFYKGKLGRDEWGITSAAEIELLPGGVTFSGGECLLQMKELVPVCRQLKEAGIHIAAETSLFAPQEDLLTALEYIDFFYADVKILDKERCRAAEGGDISLYLRDLETLMSWRGGDGKRKPVAVRIPVIGGMTDSAENRRAVRGLIERYRDGILKLELIKEHSLGEPKYRSLGMKHTYTGVSDALMEEYRSELSGLGIPVEVCSI